MEFSELIKTATVESVLLSCAGQPAVKGTLCITSHHLLLSSCPGGDGQPSAVELWLLIRNVDAVEKRLVLSHRPVPPSVPSSMGVIPRCHPGTAEPPLPPLPRGPRQWALTSSSPPCPRVQNVGWYQPPRSSGSPRDNRLAGSSGTITLRCKDLKVLQLEIPGMEECLNIASSIEALSSVDSVMMMYPFFHRPQSLRLEEGWPLLPVEQYFQQLALQTTQWRLSDVNRDFAVCPTYPPAVIVPAAVSEETLRRAARFRQGGRFPVLSYYHSRNGTVMLRSGQPLTGPNRKRCAEDEMLLGSVLDDGERGFIIDTRSAQAAKQARMTGGGTEPKSSYPQWKRLHRPLERGRPLQESFIKLVEACNDASLGMDRWLGRLESCRWLSHVKAALSTACLAAQCLDREESSVLVHGAEGTDTTLLVTALAQLILEPGCRTLKGFQGLLEREWIQAGHPFHLRCAHSAYSHARLKQEAPLFLLFLDCVWQLSRQFPFSLEFSEGLLLTLFDNAYASDYGTFLCNNEKERCLCKVKESTHSLWAWLDQPEERKKYLNPLYSPNPLVIWPSVEPQSIQLWQGLFFRWIRSSQYLDEAWAEIWRLVEGSNTAVKESTESRLSRSLSDPTAPTENER
ncbi:myotubularin-related protein 9-like isoform X1 [Gallus gallus]|uniref:myotubularin-related protein 9-like isoform X1 n=1 Tax=Gallus gallus TaxID=9031 RepID=UPI000350626F|nr:myotubularin-related protein 9-like isoform X1 [Gallus gallus]|eukprot:XP_015153334.1 myotubularin-related protein 9 isoform X1 [Gallus gallus]